MRIDFQARLKFDKKFYKQKYKDVARDWKGSMFRHFMEYGWREGRDPSEAFMSIYYAHRHMSGVLSENPLLHYIRESKKHRGIQTRPDSVAEWIGMQRDLIKNHFDYNFYKKEYGVDAGFAVDDYMNRSKTIVPRRPCRNFDPKSYLHVFPYLEESRTDPFFHFIILTTKIDCIEEHKKTNREVEQDVINSWFDREYYKKTYRDVAQVGVDPAKHFIDYGWKEGRNPSSLFWTKYYVSQNPDVMASAINPYFHYLQFGKSEGRLPNPIGMEPWIELVGAPKDACDNPGRASLADAEVVVIMPVYAGYAETMSALNAVLSNVQTTRFHLVVINDASPDRFLSDELERRSRKDGFTYIVNEANLGFPATVNRGLSLIADQDVILLNSDAVVFNDWIDRLRAHTKTRPNVATLTPYSNNATIFSYPDNAAANDIALEISGAKLDQLCADVNSGCSYIVPTGVGFCMYITNAAIKVVGLFDHVRFGKGYGEENDFCLRAQKRGFVNLHAQDVFVYHKGSVSFSLFGGDPAQHATRLLLEKHPEYNAILTQHIQADPGRKGRERIDLRRIIDSFGENWALFISAQLDGGTNVHINDMSNRLLESGCVVVHLRYSVEAPDRWSLTLHKGKLPYTCNVHSICLFDVAADFLFEQIKPQLLHIHSLAGLQVWHLERLYQLLKHNEHIAYFTIHDFGAVCRRNNFIAADGRLCSAVGGGQCGECATDDRCQLSASALQARYDAFHRLFSICRLIAPSAAAAAIFDRHFPGHEIMVKPHPDLNTGARYIETRKKNPRRRIVVVGAIGPHKGSLILCSAAANVRKRGIPLDFVLVGYSDNPAELERLGVRQTGKYANDDEAVALIIRENPDAIFYPSIFPETYGYSLNIALQLGIPAIAFPVCAYAERLSALPQNFLIETRFQNDPEGLVDVLMSLDLDAAWERRVHADQVKYRSILEDYYQFT